ncbi:LOW QUALITY PROTEIN: uncharacterized protein LOC108089603 [Drosophila ficusphila]|uniref:LOW QUALITY PROTEIN: uncharacterized protein LOC108089603 n=1 Tax=Drosophila ficusphila TaxID=30025 RepID=UPI001C89CDFA|nr:LOW QUALITY PROTEIN: uncharacterized protein LOC108089603 [Drosophila ficusphila]
MKEYFGFKGKTKIYHLNSYCFNEIFRQIKINCACSNSKDKLTKYNDLINFVTSCEMFSKAFKEWSPDLYHKLMIENTFLSRSPWLEIHFAEVHAYMRAIPINERKKLWTEYLNQIKENEQLESLKLIYIPTVFDPEHLDRFEELVKSLTNKKKLKTLVVKMTDYSFERVPEICHLENVHLDMRIDANILLQLCKSNPNLRRLKLNNSKLFGRDLAKIVPYCNQLEYLSFMNTFEANAAECEALADLPRLNELILLGEHEEGSLLKLFNRLKSKRIRRICIPETYVTTEEAIALASIKSLVSLKCCLQDNTSYVDLPLSGNLTDISILTEPYYYDDYSDQGRIKVTIRANTSNYMPDAYYEAMQTKDPMLMQKAFDQEYECAYRLRCEGYYKDSILPATLDILSASSRCFIEEIVLPNLKTISQDDMATLASIPTLTTIDCSFLQIQQVIAVKLQQLNGVIVTENRVDRIRTEFFEIRLVHGHESVTLIIIFFHEGSGNYTKLFAPFANLKNLKKLQIMGNILSGSLIPLLKSLCSLKTQSLEEIETAFLAPEEIAELVKIKSLKVLKCGFFCSRNVVQLAELPQLETLILTVHPQGSLRKLFKAQASKQVQVLKTLVIQGTNLTSHEVFELPHLRSLENLQIGLRELNNWEMIADGRAENIDVSYCEKCRSPKSKVISDVHRTFVQTLTSIPFNKSLAAQYHFITEFYDKLTPSNLELLVNLPDLRELRIYFDYNAQALENLIRTLASKTSQKLSKLSIASQDFGLLATFENLQSLECVVNHMNGIECVAQLQNLSDLHIHNPLGISVWELLKELEALPNLQCLLLDNTDLHFLDIVKVTKLNKLKRLRLGLARKKLIRMLTVLKNLEVLEITSTHHAAEDGDNFVILFLHLCPNIKSISLYRYYNYLTKDYVNGILTDIKFFRDPKKHPSFKLRGKWSNFERHSQLHRYDETFLKLEHHDSDYQRTVDKDINKRFLLSYIFE